MTQHTMCDGRNGMDQLRSLKETLLQTSMRQLETLLLLRAVFSNDITLIRYIPVCLCL